MSRFNQREVFGRDGGLSKFSDYQMVHDKWMKLEGRVQGV